jgi:hypothetical protein
VGAESRNEAASDRGPLWTAPVRAHACALSFSKSIVGNNGWGQVADQRAQ